MLDMVCLHLAKQTAPSEAVWGDSQPVGQTLAKHWTNKCPNTSLFFFLRRISFCL